MVVLVRIDPLRFRAGVPERDAPGVKLGQSVEILLEGEPQPVVATITRISPSLDLSSRSLDHRGGSSQPGSALADGTVRRGARSSSIRTPPHWPYRPGPYANSPEWKRSGECARDCAVEQPVQTGRRNEEWVEILGGIEPGDLVVVEGTLTRPGPVEVAQSL